MISVYVAGASREAKQVEHFMIRLRENGVEVSHDWITLMKLATVHERHLTPTARKRAAELDAQAVRCSDIVWLQIPDEATIGAWVEFGIVLGDILRHALVIVSGDWRRTIFTELADFKFDTHEQAFAFVCGRAEEQRRDLAAAG
jgi:hypothetical protein